MAAIQTQTELPLAQTTKTGTGASPDHQTGSPREEAERTMDRHHSPSGVDRQEDSYIDRERNDDSEETERELQGYIQDPEQDVQNGVLRASHGDYLAPIAETEERPITADLPEADRWALSGLVADDRPATTGGRMPSQMSQPRFTRTLGAGSFATTADDFSTDEEDRESDNVYITELRDDLPDEEIGGAPGWEGIPLQGNTRQYKSPVAKESREGSDGGWDTDLEDEGHTDEHDPTGRTAYSKVCERLGVVPVSYFSRHITDSEICMRFHGLGTLGTKAIARVLKETVTLDKLDLSGNWMEGEGGMYMARMLQESDYISHAVLADNKLGSEGAQHLASMLHANVTLRQIDLSGNDFSDQDAEHFARALDENKSLKELRLSRNQFGVVGGEALGPAIGGNDILESLDLSWNQIRRGGAIAVGKGLKENVRLKQCNLAWNGFGAEGGAAIAEAIAANDSLLELDISGNRLEQTTAVQIARALHHNETLRTLKIGNNPLSTAGCVALITSLKQSDSSVLVYLDLSDIPVEYEFLRIWKEVQLKRDLRVVHGPVMRSGNTHADLNKPGINPQPRTKKDPLVVLHEHIVVNDTRILDLLRSYDRDDKHSVTSQQFAAALEQLSVPFTKEQLEDIAHKLDKNNDGLIYYGDLLDQVERAVQNESRNSQRSAGQHRSSSSVTSRSRQGQAAMGKDDDAAVYAGIQGESSNDIGRLKLAKREIAVET